MKPPLLLLLNGTFPCSSSHLIHAHAPAVRVHRLAQQLPRNQLQRHVGDCSNTVKRGNSRLGWLGWHLTCSCRPRRQQPTSWIAGLAEVAAPRSQAEQAALVPSSSAPSCALPLTAAAGHRFHRVCLHRARQPKVRYLHGASGLRASGWSVPRFGRATRQGTAAATWARLAGRYRPAKLQTRHSSRHAPWRRRGGGLPAGAAAATAARCWG